MTWPSRDQVVDGTDWSWYQQNAGGTPIDVSAFCAQNPNVELFILRAVWPSGVADPLYSVYYDMLIDEGKDVAAYLWPNPIRTMDEMRGNWWTALGSGARVPKVIMGDFELTFFQSDEILTDNAEESFEAWEEDYPESEVIGYTRGNWWETHIKRTIERGRNFIVAHYPKFLLDGEWRFCRTHADLDRFLPIGNSFTPYIGRMELDQVIGFQFSAKGRLDPYLKDMDLDSINKVWKDGVYDSGADPDPDPDPDIPEAIPAEMRAIAGRMISDAGGLNNMADTLEDL